MRKLSCKTLLSILPDELLSQIQTMMTERKVSQDFDTVVSTIAEIKMTAYYVWCRNKLTLVCN